MTREILLGADPELFVLNTETQKFVSAHDLIPGTKTDPYLVRSGAVQVDGVAAEFNIQPASTADEFVNHLNTVRNRLQEMVQEVSPSYHLVSTPTATFDEEYFFNLPAEALMLGCEPDFNAYTGEQNVRPDTDQPFRTGSGHVHIGFTEYQDPFSDDHFSVCRDIVKQIDSAIFLTSKTWDSDETRRKLYGSKGSFRPKQYGVEYRPLSNAWLSDEFTMRIVYMVIRRATELYFEGVKLYD